MLQLSQRQTVVKVQSLTENMFQQNIFIIFFARNCHFQKSKWFPSIRLKVKFQEAVISAKLCNEVKGFNKIAEYIRKQIEIHNYGFFFFSQIET